MCFDLFQKLAKNLLKVCLKSELLKLCIGIYSKHLNRLGAVCADGKAFIDSWVFRKNKKNKQNKNSSNCIIWTIIHLVELLFCSSDCTIWIQQPKQCNLMNFCFVYIVWFVSEIPKNSSVSLSTATKFNSSLNWNWFKLKTNGTTNQVIDV